MERERDRSGLSMKSWLFEDAAFMGVGGTLYEFMAL